MQSGQALVLSCLLLANEVLPARADYVLDSFTAPDVIQNVADRCPGVYSLSDSTVLSDQISSWQAQPPLLGHDPNDSSPDSKREWHWGAWGVRLSPWTKPGTAPQAFSGGQGTSLLFNQLLVEEFSQDISEAKDSSLVLSGYGVTGYNEESKKLLSYWIVVINGRDGVSVQQLPGPSCYVMVGRKGANGTLVFSGGFAHRILAAQSQEFKIFDLVQGRKSKLMAISLSPDFRPTALRGIDEIPFKRPGSVCLPMDRCTRGSCAIKPRKALGRCP